MAKIRCRRKPRRRVSGYSRCPAGTKGARNTRAQRNKKSCTRAVKKLHVDGHQRKVCIVHAK